MRYIIAFTLLCSLTLLNACAPKIPKDVLTLSPTSLEDRQLQARKYETDNEGALLSAGLGILMDMGYSVEETEREIGLITCSKTADATDTAQVMSAVFVALLGGGAMPVDKEQKIRVSFVTIPSANEPDTYIARITFQRLIWNTYGQISTAETLKDPELYQNFFDKLSKSVFLEANNI